MDPLAYIVALQGAWGVLEDLMTVTVTGMVIKLKQWLTTKLNPVRVKFPSELLNEIERDLLCLAKKW
jgi:hypothetical protein